MKYLVSTNALVAAPVHSVPGPPRRGRFRSRAIPAPNCLTVQHGMPFDRVPAARGGPIELGRGPPRIVIGFSQTGSNHPWASPCSKRPGRSLPARETSASSCRTEVRCRQSRTTNGATLSPRGSMACSAREVAAALIPQARRGWMNDGIPLDRHGPDVATRKTLLSSPEQRDHARARRRVMCEYLAPAA